MKQRSPVLIALFLCAALFVPAALAELLLCPECGYENPDGSRACTHCRAALPDRGREQTEAAGSDAAEGEDRRPEETAGEHETDLLSEEGFLSLRVVRDEVREAGRYQEQGEYEVARLFYRNASALNLLTDPGSGGRLSSSLVEAIRRCETPGGRAARKCPQCDGTGKRMMMTTSTTGEVEYREVYGQHCPRCRGAGTVLKPATCSERLYRRGRAVNTVKLLQQARKFVPVGEAWVPAELESRLTLQQEVTLRRALAAPCAECGGLGRTDCRHCEGTAAAACPNGDCVNGKVEVTATDRLVRTALTRLEKCEVCDGKAEVACDKCGGKGSFVCRKCNGSGEREACGKCGGRGLSSCGRCKGTGSYRDDICPYCKGAGETLCTSCNGDGRRQ